MHNLWMKALPVHFSKENILTYQYVELQRWILYLRRPALIIVECYYIFFYLDISLITNFNIIIIIISGTYLSQEGEGVGPSTVFKIYIEN